MCLKVCNVFEYSRLVAVCVLVKIVFTLFTRSKKQLFLMELREKHMKVKVTKFNSSSRCTNCTVFYCILPNARRKFYNLCYNLLRILRTTACNVSGG
jgi:hypothetical protein